MSHIVMFDLTNGEKRLYNGVERVDTSRPHLIMVYGQQALIAQIPKRDVIRYTQYDTMPDTAPPAIRPAVPADATKHH